MVMAGHELFHVLAVDDSLIDRKLIERLLKTSSYQVTTVDSGSKALEFLGWHEDHKRLINPNETTSVSTNNHQVQEVEVNLVITDYCMPGMTGYDLLKKMKESSSLRNIPVVIMSSENVPSRINRCLEEGAEEFFLKPVRKSDVNKLTSHMMKKSKSSSSSSNDKDDEDEDEEKDDKQQQQPEEEEDDTVPQSQQQSSNNNKNKRKSMDDGPPPDRTRPRYNGLSVMSN